MKRKQLLIIILLLISYSKNINAQLPEGKWFTPLRSKLLCVSISKDSIVFAKCRFDSAVLDYNRLEMALKVEEVYNGYYIVSENRDTTIAFYFINFKLENGKNNMNIESLNTKFKSAAEVKDSIKSLVQIPLNVVFLDKSAIDKIRQKRDISTMTVEDFKNYAEKVILMDSTNRDHNNKKLKFNYLFAESTGRILLSEMGFNTLVAGRVFDLMFEKFAEDPETKDIFMKMVNRKK